MSDKEDLGSRTIVFDFVNRAVLVRNLDGTISPAPEHLVLTATAVRWVDKHEGES